MATRCVVVGSKVGLHAGQRPSWSKQRTDYQ
jgi:hypothetical protein